MPGGLFTYKYNGEKRRRRTPYRYVGVREQDWYNMHRLADKYRMSIVDTFGLMVSANLKALDCEPLTAERLSEIREA